MDARLDHVVVWVSDPLRSLEFYRDVIGLPGERIEEFRAGSAPFLSVRVSPDSSIDLMPRAAAPIVEEDLHAPGSAGHPVNHVCLALSRPDFEALRQRVTPVGTMERSFGAPGLAPHAFYFQDPDGNVIEARYYS